MSVDTSSLLVSSLGSIRGSSCGFELCSRIVPKLCGWSNKVVMYIPRSVSLTRSYSASHTWTRTRIRRTGINEMERSTPSASSFATNQWETDTNYFDFYSKFFISSVILVVPALSRSGDCRRRCESGWEQRPISDNNVVELHANFLIKKSHVRSSQHNFADASLPTPLHHHGIA